MSDEEHKRMVPDIDCKAVVKEREGKLNSYQIITLVIAIIALIFSALTLPPRYNLIVASALLLITLIIVLVILEQSKKRMVTRGLFKIRHCISKIIWNDLLKLDEVKKEFVCYYYQNRIERKISSAPKKAFQVLKDTETKKDVMVQTNIGRNTKPKYPIDTDQDEVQKIISRPIVYWNSIIYRLEEINEGTDHVTLTFGPGCYLDYVATCEKVAKETDTTLKRYPMSLLKRRCNLLSDKGLESFFQQVRKNQSTRERFADPDDLVNPVSKCMKMGISNVTILKDLQGDDYIFLLGLRSSRTIEYPNYYHVVPAGAFQPSKKEFFYDKLEGTPFGTVLRELYEECFLGEDKEEYDKDPLPLSEVMKKDGVYDIYDHRDDATKVEFKITGVYVDYLTPKLEMTTALMIKDPDYLRKLEDKGKLRTNWEHGRELLKIPFSDMKVEEWKRSKRMLPLGAIALNDAKDAFRDYLSKSD